MAEEYVAQAARGLPGRGDPPRDREEMRFHIEMRTEENVAAACHLKRREGAPSGDSAA